jgi:hypothetical protein
MASQPQSRRRSPPSRITVNAERSVRRRVVFPLFPGAAIMIAIARASLTSLTSACRAIPQGNTYGNMACRKRQHPLPHLAAFAAYVTPIHPSNPHESRLGGKSASRENQKAAKTAMFTIPVNITAVSPHIPSTSSGARRSSSLCDLRGSILSSLLLRPQCPSVSLCVLCGRSLRSPSPFVDTLPAIHLYCSRSIQRRCDAAPPPHLIGAQRPRAAFAS